MLKKFLAALILFVFLAITGCQKQEIRPPGHRSGHPIVWTEKDKKWLADKEAGLLPAAPPIEVGETIVGVATIWLLIGFFGIIMRVACSHERISPISEVIFALICLPWLIVIGVIIAIVALLAIAVTYCFGEKPKTDG